MSALMLVSASVTPSLRAEVRAGLRPCPEYLRLEQRYGVELLDWSQLDTLPARRSAQRSLRHAIAGLRRLRAHDVVFSDGEHIGIPLALAMRVGQIRTPHLMIGHHLGGPGKRRLLVGLGARRRMNRVIVHSTRQFDRARDGAGLAASQLCLIPYGVDTDFWKPAGLPQAQLILAPGREHRDFRTLAAAVESLDTRVFITGRSAHSARAVASEPARWPANVDRGSVDYPRLRELYGQAAVVVVSLLPADFPAGVTSLVEAMAMGKAIVVSATEGLAGLVLDGETAVLVPPGDAGALRHALERLLDDPAERARLGRNARRQAERAYSLDAYTGALAGVLDELSLPQPSAAPIGAA